MIVHTHAICSGQADERMPDKGQKGSAVRCLDDVGNRVAVQLYRHLPWLTDRWARTHGFVEAQEIPWTPLKKPLMETVIALVTTAIVINGELTREGVLSAQALRERIEAYLLHPEMPT